MIPLSDGQQWVEYDLTESPVQGAKEEDSTDAIKALLEMQSGGKVVKMHPVQQQQQQQSQTQQQQPAASQADTQR